MEECNKTHWNNVQYKSTMSPDSGGEDDASYVYIGANSSQFCDVMAHMMATAPLGSGEQTTRVIPEITDHSVTGSQETGGNITQDQLGSTDRITCTITQQLDPEDTVQEKSVDQVNSDEEEAQQIGSPNSESRESFTSASQTTQQPSPSNQGKTGVDSDTDLFKYSVSYGGHQLFICDLCSHMFISEFDLARHIKTHPDTSPVVRQPPRRKPYRARYWKRMDEYTKSPAGEFICKECGYSTHRQSKLMAHAKTHDVYRPYKCDKCSFSSVKKNTMYKHMLNHVQEGPFKCRDCAFTTSVKKDMQKHIEMHAKMSGHPYKCNLCPFSAVYKRTMEKHYSMKHPQESPTETDLEAPEATALGNSSSEKETEDGTEETLKSESCEHVNASTPDKDSLEDTVVENSKGSPSASKDSFPAMSDSSSEDELVDDHSDSDEDYIPEQSELNATEESHFEEDVVQNVPVKTIACKDTEVKNSDSPSASKDSFPAMSDSSSEDELVDDHSDSDEDYVPEQSELKATESHLDEDAVPNGPAKTLSCEECDFVADTRRKLTSHRRKHKKSQGRVYKCKECEYSTAHQPSLRQHMFKHTEKYPYECKECGYKTGKKSAMVKHTRTHTGERPFKCDQCDFSAAQSSTLNAHKKRVHEEKQYLGKVYECKECGYATAHRADLRQHMFRHNGKYPFECKVCGYKTGKRNAMAIHSRTHTGEKPYKCDQCDFSTTQRNSLKEHKMRHSGEKPFMCDVCGLRFVTKPNLNNHMKRHSDNPEARSKPHKCAECEYATAYKTHLATHVARHHTGEKPHMCEYCGYRTVDKSNLATHKKTHTGEREYKCDLCDYRSVEKKKLQQHKSKHTGEKPYTCTLCDFRTVYKNSLFTHLQRHTGEKPYKCDYCDYRAARKNSLKSHMAQHTGEKPHVCPDCGHRTAHRCNLLSHMRKLHKKNKPEVSASPEFPNMMTLLLPSGSGADGEL